LVNSGWRANEIGTASNSAEKKNRPREGVAEGGFGGNSATPERIQKADSPAVLLVKSRTPHKSFLFLLEEKNRRAQIKNCEENFFAGWRGFRATAGLASLLGVLLKKSSNINQKTPPIFTFCEIVRNSLGAKRLGMVFFRNLKGIFEIARQRGNFWFCRRRFNINILVIYHIIVIRHNNLLQYELWI